MTDEVESSPLALACVQHKDLASPASPETVLDRVQESLSHGTTHSAESPREIESRLGREAVSRQRR